MTDHRESMTIMRGKQALTQSLKTTPLEFEHFDRLAL
jgi:hypothetical protein